jgi:hypothetical protein
MREQIEKVGLVFGKKNILKIVFLGKKWVLDVCFGAKKRSFLMVRGLKE